jgi:hypothetical protein
MPFRWAARNQEHHEEMSPAHPQGFVDKLLMNFLVGTLQRLQIEHWRGLQQGAFGYNEGPTSSCHTFCWKARHRFDVPFFCSRPGPSGLCIAPRDEHQPQRRCAA